MDLARIVAEVAIEIEREAAGIEAAADAKEPGLAPGPFGIAIAPLAGDPVSAGSATTRFPLQSIAKVFALELALADMGDRVFERVGREPSGDPFNSIIDLERNDGIPRNPFVNAGALAVVDILCEAANGGVGDQPVVDLIRRQLEGEDVPLNEDVLASEVTAGDLNRAMLSFMKHHDNLRSDPDDVMSLYVEQCAISLDCLGLARAGRFLARTRLDGGDRADQDRAARMRRLLALMMTCGHYDGSGDFAMRAGLPAKSGVGGGILAIMPEIASIAVWSPNLDQNGNSILGVRALEMVSSRTGWSVFGPPLSG